MPIDEGRSAKCLASPTDHRFNSPEILNARRLDRTLFYEEPGYVKGDDFGAVDETALGPADVTAPVTDEQAERVSP